MAGKAFTNLNKIFLSDTFRAWFDKTNQIVSTINPLEIYGVTAGVGEVAGITMDFTSDGKVTIGLKLPDALTGDFTFSTGVTFADFVSISGLTLDLAPNGGAGATAYGRIVRSINGATGDVALDFVAIPGNSADGDILYYENTPVGATFRTYNLFSDGTAENGMFHIGGSGGIFVGLTSGGASSANEFVKQGNIQLVGATASGIYMVDNTQTLSTAKVAGADIRYGTEGSSQLLTIGGRNISGVEHSTKNLILDFNRQTIAVGGAAVSSVGTTNGIIDIRDVSNIGVPIKYTDNSGSTFAIRYLATREDGGRTTGGQTGIGVFGGNPSTKGLNDVENRVRLENTASVEVEITGSGKTSGFVVYGKDAPYGDLLLPTIHARRDGDVVIGAIGINDGSITGTTYGGLNIASGKLLVGGSAGKSVSEGYQVLHSSGSTASWRLLESTAFSYSGSIGTEANATVVNGNIVVTQSAIPGIQIRCLDRNGNNQTGPFSATFNFPSVRRIGSAGDTTGAVLGVRMTKDGVSKDEFILWDDFTFNTVSGGMNKEERVVNPSFTFSGNAESEVFFTPFMTLQTQFGSNKKGFEHVNKGAFLINFHKLG
mgnify:CR=1 FL=1